MKCAGPACSGVPLGKLGYCRACLRVRDDSIDVFLRWADASRIVKGMQAIPDETWDEYLEARTAFVAAREGS